MKIGGNHGRDPGGPASHSAGECCTRIEGLGVTLRGVPVLERVSLHVHCGEMIALIGPNGGGKTTLLRAILGEVPHTGELRFMRTHAAAQGGTPMIGYLPQKLEFDPTSPVSVLDLFAGAASRWPLCLGRTAGIRRIAAAALAQVGADDLLNRRVGQLSGGQLQRVMLALAMTPPPNLLLLDEPLSAVDPSGLHLFYHTVADLRRRYDLAILLVSHDLGVAAHVADRMVFLNRTILCDGLPQDVVEDPLVRRTFGRDLGAPDGPSPQGPVRCLAGPAAGGGTP
jgi:zinc transport system ATP-binding protein